MGVINLKLVTAYGISGWMLLSFVILFSSSRLERLRNRPPSSQMAFRKPWGNRVFFAMMAFLVTIGWSITSLAGFLSPGKHAPVISFGIWLLIGLQICIGLGMGLLLIWMSGPDDLYIDRERRTYRRIFGWPLRPRVQEGSREDMVEIYIWGRYLNQMGQEYRVGITWKQNSGWTTPLGSFRRSGQADRLAEEISALLELPMVKPPYGLQASIDRRNRDL